MIIGAGFLIIENYKKDGVSMPAIILFGMLLRKEGFVYTIPGGKIDNDEKPNEAASRELYEETAKMVKISAKRMSKYKYIDTPVKKNIFRTYYGMKNGLTKEKYILNRNKLLLNAKTPKVYLETMDMVHIYINDLKKYMKGKTRKLKTVDGNVIKLRKIFKQSLKNGVLQILNAV